MPDFPRSAVLDVALLLLDGPGQADSALVTAQLSPGLAADGTAHAVINDTLVLNGRGFVPTRVTTTGARSRLFYSVRFALPADSFAATAVTVVAPTVDRVSPSSPRRRWSAVGKRGADTLTIGAGADLAVPLEVRVGDDVAAAFTSWTVVVRAASDERDPHAVVGGSRLPVDGLVIPDAMLPRDSLFDLSFVWAIFADPSRTPAPDEYKLDLRAETSLGWVVRREGGGGG